MRKNSSSEKVTVQNSSTPIAGRFRRYLNRETLNQYASVLEQILMSSSNMLASIVVLKASGVKQFGIYSFIFVIGTLVLGVFSTLLHRQMMLKIASEDTTTQRRNFLSTIALELIGLVTLFVLVSLVFFIAIQWFDIIQYRKLAVVATGYAGMLVLFDACKQYCYTIRQHVYSLRITAVYVLAQATLLAVVFFNSSGLYTVELAYSAMSASLLISLLTNRLCQKSLLRAKWQGWLNSVQLFTEYFTQGRFSLLGMLVTWAQNQSMVPILMFLSGATVAGYFSIGRLLTMPMAVVNQGLVNSSTPTLRRLYNEKGYPALVARIKGLLTKTYVFSIVYIALLAVTHFTGLLDTFIPDYQHVRWYVMLWLVLIFCSISRFWRGQFFVVSMNFQFLLRVSIIALMVTLSGVIIFGIGFNSVMLALTSVVAGELVSIMLYRLKQVKVLEA